MLILALSSSVAIADLASADRAYVAENYAAALEGYLEVLESQPENPRALLRAARLLSWENRLQESVDLYDRAIQATPGERDALLGRATVLSWDGQTSAALIDFERLVERDPGDVEALLGMARCYAWSGRHRQARTQYERVLQLQPDQTGARVGLAYLDLWSGDLGRARKETLALQDEQPNDRDVKRLVRDLSKSVGAWWMIDLSRLTDTDDNELDSWLLSGGLGLGGGVRLDLGYGRYEMEDLSGSTSIDNLHGILSMHPARGQRLALQLGMDRRTDTGGMTDEDFIGGLRYSWGLDRRWQLHASAMRHAVRYSPLITDNGITFDQVELNLRGTIGDRTNLFATIGSSEFSDDNERIHALAGFLYRLPVRPITMQVGYTGRYMDYDADLANGYFDPQSFTAHLAQLRLSDRFGARQYYWNATVDGGIQSFTVGGSSVDNDGVFIVAGTIGVPLKAKMNFELYGNYSNYAANNAAGFESRTFGLRLKWRAGLKGLR
jgi:tetratricopeptide (TPR) repeat protein